MALEWLTVSQAAAALGVSTRTVQKRIARGEIEARRVPWQKGERFEIEARTLSANQGRSANAIKGESSANGSHLKPGFDAQASANPKRERSRLSSHSVRASNDLQLLEITREALADVREQNAFLRATVEQHQRSEAELRASLREALRAMPKQITQGSAPDVTRNAQSEPEAAAMGNDGPTVQSGPDVAPESLEESEVDLSEIDELIWKVFK